MRTSVPQDRRFPCRFHLMTSPTSTGKGNLPAVHESRVHRLRVYSACPAGVDIPGCFALYNAHRLFPKDRAPRFQYIGHHGGLIGDVSYAGLAGSREVCEACPQLPPANPRLLKDVKADMKG